MAMGPIKSTLRHVDRLFSEGNVAALTDDALIDRYLVQHDHNAFAALVARHGPRVLGTCRSVLGNSAAADDAFQEVFLTLSRRARTIQGRRSVDAWLYRVAHRVSCRALSEARRRGDRERRFYRSEAVLGTDSVTAQEARTAVNDELDRLPERYRQPVILCLMEGRTQPEVAVALKVSEGAIRGRLARARALLRSRLARVGLAPAVAAAAMENLEAAVPSRLVESTLQVVFRQTAIVGTSAAPMKIAAAVLIAIVTLTAATIAMATTPPAPATASKRTILPFVGQAAPEVQKLAEKLVPDGSKIVFRGRVLDSQNHPIANARFFLVSDAWAGLSEQTVKIEPDGSYRLEVPESTFRKNFNGGISLPQVQASLTVTSLGFGPDWLNIEPGQKDEKAFIKPEYAHDFHLPADREISGKLLDQQGKPVADATVWVSSIAAPVNDWEPILTDLRKGDVNALYNHVQPARWRSPINWAATTAIAQATTDANGQFRLTGAGGDRLVSLKVSGPGIRDADFFVLNRENVDDLAQAIRDKYPYKPDTVGHVEAMKGIQTHYAIRVFGSTFTAQVDPARTVSGTVRDAVTGQPVVSGSLGVVSNAALGGSGQIRPDANGHYQGVRWDGASTIWVTLWFYGSTPYLNAARKFENVAGIGDVVADFQVQRGVIVTGKVLELGTNKPIVSNPRDECGVPGALQAGFVHYRPLATNTALRSTPSGQYFEVNDQTRDISAPIGGDGSFEITVPPGHGVLLVETQPGMPMTVGWGGPLTEAQGKLFPYAKLRERTKNDGGPGDNPTQMPGFNQPIAVTDYEAYKVIDPAADATTLTVDMTVPRAPSRVVLFVDTAGKPVRGVSIFGLLPPSHSSILVEGSEAEVLALDASKPREILALSKDGHLFGKAKIVPGDTPISILMEPAPALSGRLLNATKIVPVADYSVNLIYYDPADPDWSASQWEGRKLPHPPGQLVTDAEGRFQILGLIPGRHFKVTFHELKRAPNFPNGSELDYEPKPLQDVVLKPGETRDLGQIAASPVKR